MDRQRLNEIYDEIGRIHVQLHEDPRVMGPGYISRTIQKCREAEEQANIYYTEVQKEISDYRQALSLKELERKVRLRQKLQSPEIRSMEVSASEREANAEALLEAEYRAEKRASLEARGEEAPEHITSLEEEIVEIRNQISSLTIVLDVIKEKKTSLNKTDSAVRLQEKSMETEARVFGGPPAPVNNRNRNPPRNGHPITTAAWDRLTGGQETAQENPPAGEANTTPQDSPG